jgi:4-hydroxybenzoate polyprenyltransferase
VGLGYTAWHMPTAPSPSPLDELAQDLTRPLCVDLDGTLIRTDSLWEGVAHVLARRPWLLIAMGFWLLSGRAAFKAKVSTHGPRPASSLPYRAELVEALRAAKAKGRRLVLATAADRNVADGVEAHLRLFDEVLASDGHENLKGKHKRDALSKRYGSRGFDYVGDSAADLAVFEGAATGYLIGAAPSVVARARSVQNIRVITPRQGLVRALVKQLRVHQWAKNALVLVPLMLAQGTTQYGLVGMALVAAGTFSLCASAGYVLNDLLDLEADRVHPEKSRRPFASGALPILLGPPLFVGLLALSFGVAAVYLSPAFIAMLALYFVGTVTYSLYLKRLLLVDVLVLAGLYTHRIIAGGIATHVPVSAWLLAFSLFIFLSLAFAKRFIELKTLTGDGKVRNRGYYATDLGMVGSMGTASGYIAALVFSLYVELGSHAGLYRAGVLLWLAVPVLLFWISRIWILSGRGQMQEDPVKFALKDPVSMICGVLVLGIAFTARTAPAIVMQFLQME